MTEKTPKKTGSIRDAGTAVGVGRRKKLRTIETCKKQKNRYQLYLLLLSNTVDLRNNKRNHRKICFNSILIYPGVRQELERPSHASFSALHPWIHHEIIYDAVMKKTHRSRFPSFERSGGQCPRSPASLLTAISSHCLAALPAKMSAFNSHMRQNVYYRNLKWTLEDLLPLLLLHNKDQQ